MTVVLVRKLLRDLRWALLAVALLLAAFQGLWARITGRILGDLSPFFRRLAALGGLTEKNVQQKLFEGPGQIISTLIGGESLTLNSAMDFLSIGYVHPLVMAIFCIWAVGRAAGALAGELDRGTAELLLAQPLPRSRVILAHFCVDLLVIPVLCLSLWFGTWLGTSLMGPIQEREEPLLDAQVPPMFRALLKETPEGKSQRLEVRPFDFGAALWAVGGLIFAVSGYTMWLSSLGRFRWRVLGIAVLITLVMFLVNLLGQLWEVLRPLRPMTIFYYYQPQHLILGKSPTVTFAEWNGGEPLVRLPSLVVLYSVGLIGYALALWSFRRRDVPAPL
jgi:ABC-2 type transport system permease protein